jgi:prohibitin 1
MSARVMLGFGGIILLLFVFVFVAPSPTMIVSIAAGHEGALYKRFGGGTDVENVYDEGFHFIWPWNSMNSYDARFQTRSVNLAARTRDGTNLQVDVAVTFRATRRNVPLLHKYIGADYVEKLVLPSLGARVREEVSLHTPEEVYSTQRLAIQQRIREEMRRQYEMDPEADTLLQRVQFIEIEAIFLQGVELPADPRCPPDHTIDMTSQTPPSAPR